VLQVQRNWMYLENIFIGSEDIRKQLPQESLMFDQVHATFMVQMQQLNTAHNVVQVSKFYTQHSESDCFQPLRLCLCKWVVTVEYDQSASVAF